MNALNIAILNTTGSEVREKLQDSIIHEFSIAEGISIDFENIDAFVIDFENDDTANKSLAIDLVKKIRANVNTYLKPIFCTMEGSEVYTMQRFTTIEDLRDFADIVKHEISTIEQITQNSNNITNDWQARFLIYLYTRRSIINLTPAQNKSKNTYYSYPVIDVFAQDELFDYYEWIHELKDKGILEFKKFIKSFFYCSNCPSAHALFSERCPECHSEDIQLADFLHCYTCGNIAPEVEFMTADDGLVCRQCKSKLKHIGVDYDRPLESYSCRSCQAVFIDSEVVTECVDCGTITLTEQMRKQNVVEYSLTNKAKHYIRMSLLEYSMSVFDDINYIAPEFFYGLVDWAYSMQYRNSEYEFSLVQISIFDYLSMQDISIISKALREVLRQTDMLTRVTQYDIWLWLPNTHISGANVVVKKLKQIHINESNNIDQSVRMKAYHSKELESFITAEKFLKGLSLKE